MRSDQGTNFVGAKKELKEALSKLDHHKIGKELLHEVSGNARSEVCIAYCQCY